MTFLDAIILGILQGLTEFLPVSSSGHLVLAQALLEVEEPGVSFEVLMHLGTLLSVLVYFRSRIYDLIRSIFVSAMTEERRIVLFLIIGTVPAGLAGVLLKDFFERAFGDPAMTSVMLFVTGALLLLTRFIRKADQPIKLGNAILMGIGQAMAIMPGISRSGATIATGMIAGVNPAKAAEFSFLLAIPAIAGATVLQADQLMAMNTANLAIYFTGALMSFLTGLGAVYGVLATIRRGKFDYFAYYCFAAGALGLYLFL
ncbi:undecaprenyl-diphosphate phosphatase [candidate division GN15 bacterium]|nr:undecaprenyl-diphosphate phosphatase [candidate division GN15 bacterium]